MKRILRIVINAVSILIATLLIPGFIFSGSILNLIVVGIVFGLVNAVIRPVVKILSLPITFLTLGLFTLAINTLMLLLTVRLLDSLSIEGGTTELLLTAFMSAIIISTVSTIMSWFLPDNKKQVK